MRGFFVGERWNKWNADDTDRTDWSKDLEQSGPQITQMEAIRTDWIAAGNQNKWNEDKTDRNKNLEQDLICKTTISSCSLM